MTQNTQPRTRRPAFPNRPKRATLKDVAKKADVSVATVSYVLNNSGSVSELVAARVREAVAELGYRPNKTAQAMRTGRTQILGLVLPDLRNPFFPELAHEIEMVARHNNYSILLTDTGLSTEIESDCLQRLAQRGVDGIIWFPATQKDTMPPEYRNIPVVVIDRNLTRYDTVVPDHFLGGQLQARHLIEGGRREIAIVSGPVESDNMRLRLEGANEELRRHGLSVAWQEQTGFTSTLAPQVKERLKEGGFSGIIAGNDIIAIAILRELDTLGLAVPADVAVVGFDNISWAEVVKPSLSTIRMPLADIAQKAFAQLTKRLDTPTLPVHHQRVGVELVQRDSSQPSSA